MSEPETTFELAIRERLIRAVSDPAALTEAPSFEGSPTIRQGFDEPSTTIDTLGLEFLAAAGIVKKDEEMAAKKVLEASRRQFGELDEEEQLLYAQKLGGRVINNLAVMEGHVLVTNESIHPYRLETLYAFIGFIINQNDLSLDADLPGTA